MGNTGSIYKRSQSKWILQYPVKEHETCLWLGNTTRIQSMEKKINRWPSYNISTVLSCILIRLLITLASSVHFKLWINDPFPLLKTNRHNRVFQLIYLSFHWSINSILLSLKNQLFFSFDKQFCWRNLSWAKLQSILHPMLKMSGQV